MDIKSQEQTFASYLSPAKVTEVQAMLDKMTPAERRRFVDACKAEQAEATERLERWLAEQGARRG
jgi:hypothetical protein